jgi:hypothetical protein
MPPDEDERRAFAGRAGDLLVLEDGGMIVAACAETRLRP